MSLATIVKRLPLHRQLNNSQAALIKFAPTWATWSKNNLPDELLVSVILNNFDDYTLTISCTSPTAASQLKHQQVSLLSALHDAGFKDINRINIQIDHLNYQTANQTVTNQKISHQQSMIVERKTSANTIKSIESCQKKISNDRLASSLSKLASTLKKAN